MRNALVTVVLVFAIAATGQQPSQPPQTGQSGNVPTNQKTIKDPAEYNAYIAALNTTDNAARGAAMEAFIKQYPQSIVLTDALEQAMDAYQKAGNTAKVEDMARRILQLMPNHIQSLTILTYDDRIKAAGGDQAALKEGCADALSGLQQLPTAHKPDSVSDADFAKQKNTMSDIFNGMAGFCALQSKDYAGAKDYYQKSLQIDPTNLQDTYQLALSLLEPATIDVNGLWYCGKAVNLAQKQSPQAVDGITKYCKYKYRKFHGGDDGWDAIVAAAAGDALPADFAASVKPAPTPCELAVSVVQQAVQQNNLADLSFGDKEFILEKAGCSPANKDAADKVWQSIQDTEKHGEARLKINVKVISATKDAIEAAISDDNQTANKADLHVQLEKPVLHPPAAGETTDIIGVITNYTPDPFLFTMEHAELPPSKAAPAHHGTKKSGM